MLSSDSTAKRRQLGHRALPRRNTGAASGSNRAKAMAQRSRLSVMGETSGATMRPTTALPAQKMGGRVSNTMVLGLSLACMVQDCNKAWGYA